MDDWITYDKQTQEVIISLERLNTIADPLRGIVWGTPEGPITVRRITVIAPPAQPPIVEGESMFEDIRDLEF